ncbi:MAG: ribonuclease domain-containing protein [Geminicoccaceae bacterium]
MLGLVLVFLLGCAAALADEATLTAFAKQQRLKDVQGFVETVTVLRETGKLPDRYVTKNQARRLGWEPGEDLCDAAPGHSIGGDKFGNFEKRLPNHRGRVWREADLDFACGRRGAKRLLWSNDGLMMITVDHYETFTEVPK